MIETRFSIPAHFALGIELKSVGLEEAVLRILNI
jgi:hypothetical protein